MLVIRQAQMDAMTLHLTERAPWDHLRENFPGELEYLGAQRISELIGHARAQCERYGIDDLAGLLRYLNLLIILGAGFDSAGPFAWSAEILAGQGASDARFRAIFVRLGIDESDA